MKYTIKSLILAFTCMCMCSSCRNSDTVRLEVTSEVINAGYLGNGVEWDPYDEAEAWGVSISEEDWQKLFKRLDFMRMGYVRCMINSPFRYYDAATGKYDKERNIHSISKLLRYCTDNDITVMYGEYNPPTWDMKDDQRWIDMSVDYLNYLVDDLGFSCIKYFVIFNEPDGNWASTNGDYELWKSVMLRFADKMKEYPALSKVTFAAPDAVINYRNPASGIDAVGWIEKTASDVDSLVGIYDIHAYPGQYEVRSGSYAETLAKHKAAIPKGKKIVLGEAGYKYWHNPPQDWLISEEMQQADSVLWEEYRHRVERHPFTKGSDCNMLVYDYFYGLDMPLLCMEVMNGGYSGIAVWMLDDAMHSNWDSGKTEDVKIWGMWNILGEEVFNDPSQEEIRPWYYTWALMCRYFPARSDILRITGKLPEHVKAVASKTDLGSTIALVNFGHEDASIELLLEKEMIDAKMYLYKENDRKTNEFGHPVPTRSGINITGKYLVKLESQSFILLTDINYNE